MSRSAARITFLIIALLLIVGVAAVLWYTREQSVGYYTDADVIRRPARDAAPRDVLWEPSKALDYIINTPDHEYEPCLCLDGAAMFFVRGKAGENANIYYCLRTPDGWGEPVALDEINTDAQELGPEPSADGRTLYFYSDREGGLGGYDLWVSHKQDGRWREPINVGPQVNSGFNEYGPALTPDGGELYFSSNRPRPTDAEIPDPDAWPATVREDVYQRDYDIYVAPLTDRGVGNAEEPAELNSPYNEGSPAISPLGDFIYFSSDRPGGEGGFDLYRSRRLRGEHLDPENVGPAVNTAANELDPGVGMGGFELHFSSDRLRADDASEIAGDYDLYSTRSREVFLEYDTYRARIDWRAIAPYVPWALLALLLLLLLLLLRRLALASRFATLSLLARCLIVSALLHALAMMLFGFWTVSSALSDWAHRGGGVRVAVVSPSVGDDLAVQVRGGLSEIAVEPVVDSALQNESMPDVTPVEAARQNLDTARTQIETNDLPDRIETSVDAPIPVTTEDWAPSTDEAEPTDELTPLALELPEMARPEENTEALLEPQVAAQTVTAQRQESKAPQPTGQVPVAVEVVPAPSDPALGATTRDSLASPISPEDAPSANQPLPGLVTPTVPPESLVVPQPDLPLMPEPPTERVMETERQVPAAPGQQPRMYTSDLEPREPAAEPVIRLTPPSPADDRAEDSLADPSEAVADAPPSADHSAGPTADQELADPGMIALPLDAMPESQVPDELEQQQVIEVSTEATPRQGLVAPVATRPPTDHIVDTLDRTAQTVPEEIPLIEEQITDADVAPPITAADINPPMAVQEPLPLELSLPSVDEERTQTVPELAPQTEARDARESERAAADNPLAPDAPMRRSDPSPQTADESPGLIDTVPLIPIELRESPSLPIELDDTPAELALLPLELDIELPPQIEPPPEEEEEQLAEVTGLIRGSVRDAVTGGPLVGATVRLDLADTAPVIATTDEQGEYLLSAPDVPDFVAVSASLEDYTPQTVNVSAEELERQIVRRDFVLTPQRSNLIAIEPDPRVHHLGDDVFGGRINSQFQRRSEGRRHRASFEVTEAQLAMAEGDAVLHLMAKGTQRDNQIRINGRQIEPSLNHSPPDGSFGEYEGVFPVLRLHAGTNTLEIRSVWADRARTDSDDFEFVNIQIELPTPFIAAANPHPQRAAEHRHALLELYGGSDATEDAVALALDWLARHQSADGRWDSDGFDEDDGASAGRATMDLDIGTTSLALLSFLTADHTHLRDGPYRDVVARGIDWLLQQQDEDGSLLGEESMYSHGAATLALAEALAMTGDLRLQRPVSAAARLIVRARNRDIGGWSHAPGKPGDTACLGWQVMAMDAAFRAGVDVPDDGFEEAHDWLDLISTRAHRGRYAYQPGMPPAVETTAEALFVRQLLDVASDDDHVDESAGWILQNPPVWEDDPDTYYWYFATLAMFQHQGPSWRQWNEQVTRQILSRQVVDGPGAGSWPVEDQWSVLCGRLYQTAMCALTLEVYYRYPVLDSRRDAEPVSTP